MEELKVDIWSDIRCPFCYLGKKRFEAALEQFPYKNIVRVEWHSFELNPYLVPEPGKSTYDYLAEHKNISREQSVRAHEQVAIQAKQLGLDFNFDKAVVANSFHAHRLAHLAKVFHLENVMEESLFKAYFTDGKDISDFETLIQLGKKVGIPGDKIEAMFNSEDYTDNVLLDEAHARELGITGVPFFLFIEKISIVGAQAPETFLRALLKSREQLHSVSNKPDSNAKTYVFRKL